MGKIRLQLLAAAAIGMGSATPAAACSDSPYIGAICYMVSQYCPYGYVEANGALLAVQQYQALYSLVGVTFGGDGRSTFGIPNLRARTPVGWGQVAGLTPVGYGQYVGQESVMLTPTMMAPHNHPATFVGTGGGASGTTTVTVGPIAGTGQSVSNLPFSATASLPLSGNASLPVTADANIGTSNSSGRTQNIASGLLLTSTPISNAAIYAPSANGNNVTIGQPGAITGTAAGPLTGVTASGTVSGTASGGTISGTPTIPQFSFDVPTGGITGGTVTVGANIQSSQQVVTPVRNPAVGLTACIAVLGTYPTRP